MGEPGAVVIALMGHEDLGFMGQTPEGGGMDDPVAIALEFRPRRRDRLGVEAATAGARIDGIWRAVC